MGRENGVNKSVWTDSLVASAQIVVGVEQLGDKVDALESHLLKGGLTEKQVSAFRQSGRGVSPEVARASINFNLDLVAQAGLDVDQDLIRAGARAVSSNRQEAVVRAAVVGGTALGRRYYGR